MPLGPAQTYIVTYNGQQFPGYVQAELRDHALGVADNYAANWDGSLTQYIGLQNQDLKIDFRLWEPDYISCKNQFELAKAIIRTQKHGWGSLIIDATNYPDRYYKAVPKEISFSKNVPTSPRILDYSIIFETQPWMTSTYTNSITGTGTIDTDQVGRTLASGIWSPCSVLLSGTDVTISGYSDFDPFTGFVSVSGTVSNLQFSTEYFASTITGTDNANGVMAWKDYQLWVAPGKTYFDISGASDCTIVWNDRW